MHRVIGRDSEGVTRTQCEEFIEQARTDARAMRGSTCQKAASWHSRLTKRAVTDYIERLEQTGGKNLVERSAGKLQDVPVSRFFGTMRLGAITGFSVERYKKQRLDQGATAATVNRELATLSHLFSKAVEWQWLDHKPARPVKLTESGGRIIALTDERCNSLMAAAVAGPDPDLWLFIAFGLNTAMRHREILSARWDRLDLANCRLFIPDAKAGEREQPITPELAEMLAA